MLKILTVGYNEEENLEKLYSSLVNSTEQSEYKFFYVDQESNDKSLEVAKKYGAETFTRENKGYADPDKKWLVDNVCNTGDFIFIADADFYLPEDFLFEIRKIINENKYDVIWITRDIMFLGIKGITVREAILFKKGAVEITEDIHNYYKVISKKEGYARSSVICNDLKEKGKSINIWLNRINRYTDIEANNFKDIQKGKLICLLFFSPIIWFFGYGIIHKQFFRGTPGYINCFIQFIYRVSLYSKVYEKKFIK